MRSFAILFSTILAMVMLQIDPAGMIRAYAKLFFGPQTSAFGPLPLIVLSFLIPALASRRLAHGLNGWVRHLPFSSTANRRGMAVALLAAQIPLALGLVCLGLVAMELGLDIALPSARLALILAAGVLSALPVRRRHILIAASLGSVFLAASSDLSLLLASAALLIAAELSSGQLCPPRRRKPWRTAGPALGFVIAWRALGWRTPAMIVISLIPLFAAYFFIRNNELPASVYHASMRLGGILAAVLVLAGLANKLAERRPVWPLARSFPWSAAQRIREDAMFLGFHAILPVLIVALRYPLSAVQILAVIPWLVFRAAAYVRIVPRLLAGARRFLVEGACAAALVCLVPWMSLLLLAAAPLAFISARRSERTLKATAWEELHHAPLGDTLSWSE